jgi:VanZ family protein
MIDSANGMKTRKNAGGSQVKPTNQLLRAIAFKLSAPLIMVALWVLSSQSTLPVVKGILGFDKVQHFAAYAALALATGFWFSRESLLKRSRRVFVICAAIASVYGIFDEFHQYFVPGRSCDIWDWVADSLGGAAGAAVILLAARLWENGMQARKTAGSQVNLPVQ